MKTCKHIFTLLLAFCPLILVAQEVQQSDVRLEYSLYPGTEYILHLEIEQNTTSESFFNEEISMYNQLSIHFLTDSVDSEENYCMSVFYRDLLISMLAPQMSLDINSSTGHSTMLKAMVDLLEKESFHVVMDRTGSLVSINGLEEALENLDLYPATDSLERSVIVQTLDEAYGLRSFQMFFKQFLSYFPKVQPVQNWTSDFTYYLNSRAVPMSNSYYLGKVSDAQFTIQGIGMLSSQKDFNEVTSIGEVKSKVSGSQTFDFQVDSRSGWLRRCVSRQRLIIETTVVSSHKLPSGLKMPSFTETYFEVTGEIRESDRK